jgi:FKBP-type peptidyl-prolyl cis-trans isomerase SlpA
VVDELTEGTGETKPHDTVVAPGTRVVLHYRISFSDGREVDSSFGDEPLTLLVGSGEMAEGLERLLMGLAAGERRRFEVEAWRDIFGAYDPERVQVLDRADFPQAMEVAPDTVAAFDTPDGEQIAGVIREVEGDKVTVDFNHPLIGQNFVYEVEVLDIQPAEKVKR